MVAGILACGTTHAAMTPLDVTKCNMQVRVLHYYLAPCLTRPQVNPGKYKGLFGAVRTIIAEEGSGGLLKGVGPTLIGYSLQGLFKYGLYEVFKDAYMNLAGEEASHKYKGAIWLAGSASAEVFADIALCPLEMTKVKIQTSPLGTFPIPMGAALKEMSRMKAETRYPFGSLVPLWSRQIPYTMAKFFFFEYAVQMLYRHVFTAPKETYGKPTQLGITFAAGYLAGIGCALVSHPADSLVSQMGRAENKGKSVSAIASEVGIVNLATRGLGTRMFMVGTLTG